MPVRHRRHLCGPRLLSTALALVAALGLTLLAPTPVEAATPPHRFPDVPAGAFYDAPVRWLQGEEHTSGVGSTGRFFPDRSITRAEAATLIWRVAGSPAPTDPLPPFPDAQAATYYRTAVAWLHEQGVVNGVGTTGLFQPDLVVSRAQAAAMLHRLAGEPPTSPDQPFTDVPVGAYFDLPVRWMSAEAITTGVGGTTRFEPHRAVTRGELATFLWRYEGQPPAPDLPPAPVPERVFTDQRVVALYGYPGSPVLGALGEQGLDASVARAELVAAGYPGADGRRVVPAFDIIASLATAAPGPDGDYSAPQSIAALRPWVDRAAQEGYYVILDLQPGRTDFLTQARLFEELLREPHVGLALDPEWRLGPGELHGSVGTVSAAEVQATADWLAALTRDNGLPPKIFIVHQFRIDMFPDRHLFIPPAELDAVIQMDGLGSQAQKDQTWNVLNGYGAADRFWWGWKNFYEDDVPLATPQKVEGLSPSAVYVSYQ